MGITIYEIMNMFIEPSMQRIQIWNNTDDVVVFDGYITDDNFEEFENEEVTSIDNACSDNKGIIVLNIQ